MFGKKLLKISITFFIIILIFMSGIWLLNKRINNSAQPFIYQDIVELPERQVVLILGSKVYENGFMSQMLADRVETAIKVYQSGRVKKILVSGDHGRKQYDEVNTVKDYLLKQGIPKEDIFLDHAGFDTYDSMYRAQHIFEVDSVIVSTQDFHLPRAIYIARGLGLNAIGIRADRREYQFISRNYHREYLAKVKAWLDVILKSSPKFLGEKIPITGDSQLSWD